MTPMHDSAANLPDGATDRRHLAESLRDRRGFTLAEMMVGLTLGAIGSAVLFSIFVGTQSAYLDTQKIVFGGGDTRAVLGLMTQEIRSAGSDERNIGIQRIALASQDSLRLISDLDGNGVIAAASEPAENVVYFYDATSKTLERDTGGGAAMLMEGVVSFAFRYLDAQGNPVANGDLNLQQRGLVRSIAMNMVLEPAKSGGAPIHMDTLTALRNDVD
jgi:prepilin-type N-terminal cleavage/methylation domain-containing protein